MGDAKRHWLGAQSELRLFHAEVSSTVQRAQASEIDWETAYHEVFNDSFQSRVQRLGLNWLDPDTTYQDDLLAFFKSLTNANEKKGW